MQVAIWDWTKVYERQVYQPHAALTNNIRFLPGGDGMSCCTASADGKLKVRSTSCATPCPHTAAAQLHTRSWPYICSYAGLTARGSCLAVALRQKLSCWQLLALSCFC